MSALYHFTLKYPWFLVVASATIAQIKGIPEEVALGIIPATGIWCMMCFAFALDRLFRGPSDGGSGPGPKRRARVIQFPVSKVEVASKKAA